MPEYWRVDKQAYGGESASPALFQAAIRGELNYSWITSWHVRGSPRLLSRNLPAAEHDKITLKRLFPIYPHDDNETMLGCPPEVWLYTVKIGGECMAWSGPWNYARAITSFQWKSDLRSLYLSEEKAGWSSASKSDGLYLGSHHRRIK